MRLLLDTCALLWIADDSDQISIAARTILAAPESECFYSLASLWEIAIKIGLRKLDLPVTLKAFFQQLDGNPRRRMLTIQKEHLLRYATLPLHHRDPFDRLIVAQALSEDLTIVGNDTAFDAYGVRRLW
jgi:PIN domain nuclease of toxin-antitoxin system